MKLYLKKHGLVKHYSRKFAKLSLPLWVVFLCGFDVNIPVCDQYDELLNIIQCESLARDGNTEATFYTAYLYDIGAGTEQNYEKAVSWYRVAAEKGYVSAQLNLGYMYSNGLGVDEDLAEMVKWYTFAAEQGDVDAQYNLGLFYKSGREGRVDIEKATKWYQLAADQGDDEALEILKELQQQRQ